MKTWIQLDESRWSKPYADSYGNVTRLTVTYLGSNLFMAKTGAKYVDTVEGLQNAKRAATKAAKS